MIYIGIDTGVNTGMAVWDSKERKFKEIETVKIHVAMKTVADYISVYGRDNVVVKVVDARQRRWYGREADFMSREAESKKFQGVGSVKRDCTIWEDYLKDAGVRFHMIAPKDNITKMDADKFRNLTGWAGRTNEHNRDAAMLVFGF